MSLGAPFKFVVAWDEVEERFPKRLAMWKCQYIYKGGRITLIRSTLSNLPIYFMSILQLPREVRLRMKQIQRGFLWGGGALGRRPYLSWRFANERGVLWNQVISGKYGEEQGGWCSWDVREGYGVGLWKAIRKLGHIVSSRLSFVVGNDQRDVWTRIVEGRGHWSPRFIGYFNDWEMDEVEGLLLRLCGQKVIVEKEDRVW
ncbi:putative ribonuclease H protein [Vitis vinifera]|uniref:Putative ribonuclease H protein n=1 Tax=Vitis vinifera TaxID=29760 RepID=A0A438EYL9_VITVI|nr:putative ribonuclease H protein [Vitis vinifera]